MDTSNTETTVETTKQLPAAFHHGPCTARPCVLCEQNATTWILREHRRKLFNLTTEEAESITPFIGPRKKLVPPPIPKALPCKHRGEFSGEKMDCQVCGGGKDIEIFKCPLHGECTTNQLLIVGMKKYPNYHTCLDYQAAPQVVDGVLIEKPKRVFTKALKWAYGITTIPQRRRTTFITTLNSLRNGGFDKPWLFIDRCSCEEAQSYREEFALRSSGITNHQKPITAYGNWVLAAWELYLRNPNVDRYAIFQDDVITCQNLRRYLEMAPYPENGYCNLYTFPENEVLRPRLSSREIHGWYRSNQAGLGALGLMFSNEALRNLLSHKQLVHRMIREDPENLQRRTKAIDGAVVESFRGIGWREYVHYPSLVQHIGHESTLGNPEFPTARSFPGTDADALSFLESAQP